VSDQFWKIGAIERALARGGETEHTPLVKARDEALQAKEEAHAKKRLVENEFAQAQYDAVSKVLEARHGRHDRLPPKMKIDAPKGLKRGKNESEQAFAYRQALGSPYHNMANATLDFMSVIPQRMRDAVDRNLVRMYDTTARAHYSSGTIRVEHHEKDVIFHELMHGVERDPVELGISKAYLESRAAGSKLSMIYPPSRKELGWKDEFSDHYTGKYYDTATEIMSMGIQGLMFGKHKILDSDRGLAAHVMGRLMRKG
jgi:hypothetical protein